METDRATVQTPRTILRLPNEGDVPALRAFFTRNAEFLAPFSPLPAAGFLTEAYWHGQVAIARRDFANDRSIRRFLFDPADPDRVIGYANLSGIVRGVGQYANLGYALDREGEGRGLMFEALETALPHAFEAFGLHRIQANYLPTNERSGQLLRRLGFVVEGYARDYLYIAGAWRDHVLTSLTNPHPRPAP